MCDCFWYNDEFLSDCFWYNDEFLCDCFWYNDEFFLGKWQLRIIEVSALKHEDGLNEWIKEGYYSKL